MEVYISFGSMINNKKLLINCINILLPLNKTINISSGKFTSELKAKYRKYSKLNFYEFAPQMELLSKANIFITHGGSNSICESITTKTPMIVIPITFDEFLNAEMIEKAGIGLKIENKIVSLRNNLLNKYYELITNSSFQNNIEKVKKEINNYDIWNFFDKVIEGKFDDFF